MNTWTHSFNIRIRKKYHWVSEIVMLNLPRPCNVKPLHSLSLFPSWTSKCASELYQVTKTYSIEINVGSWCTLVSNTSKFYLNRESEIHWTQTQNLKRAAQTSNPSFGWSFRFFSVDGAISHFVISKATAASSAKLSARCALKHGWNGRA